MIAAVGVPTVIISNFGRRYVGKMEFIEKIILNVLLSLYQSFNAAAVLAVLFMFVYIFARDYGYKSAIKLWINNFKKDKEFRKVFFLAFYTAMMLFRTLLARSYWTSSLGNVIGFWGLHDASGNIYTENIENFILFVPFCFLLLWSLSTKIFEKKKLTFLRVAASAVKISFGFSVLIELCQLLFKLGTFQLSDMFFNTLGGLAGGVIYYLLFIIKRKN